MEKERVMEVCKWVGLGLAAAVCAAAVCAAAVCFLCVCDAMGVPV